MADQKEQLDVVIVPDRRAANPYRRPFLILVVAICFSLMLQAFTSGFIWFVANDTNKIVADIEFRNSPENVKAQEDRLNEVILTVDCNNRFAVQEAFDQLEAQGLLRPGSVTITNNCTTTTVPGG